MIKDIRGKPLKRLFSEEAIKERVREIAQEITRDYRDKNPVLVGVLKGAFVFLSDLVRNLDFPMEIDFIRVSTYKQETKPGKAELLLDVTTPLKGRHVLLVEDILDTGVTLDKVQETLLGREPASFRICALVNKTARRGVSVRADYRGFEMGEGFIVGYGIDWAEEGRNLRDIWVVGEED